jgi:hypothetical protein
MCDTCWALSHGGPWWRRSWKDPALLLHRREHATPAQRQPYQMRQRLDRASLESECCSQKQCVQESCTARSDGTRQSPATLAASADRAQGCYSRCVRRCGSCFLDAVFVRQRISSRWFLVSGLVSRPFSHSTARPGAHLHIITPIHPSLPNAPVLVAPRTFCCDSNFRCPTGDRRVLARVISALTAIAVDQAPSDTYCTQRSMTALLRAFLPTEVNVP